MLQLSMRCEMKKCFFLGIWVVGLLLSSLIAEAAGNPALGAVEQSQKVRAWHFVLRAVPLDRAYWMVDQAHTAGFNTVVVTVTDGVNLQNAPWKLCQLRGRAKNLKSG